MEFKKEELEKASKKGSEEVSKAFSRLAGVQVEVESSSVKNVLLNETLDGIKEVGSQTIVVYSQVVIGGPAPGVSFLTLSRESALALVDILNQQEVGTTGILKDIDRSALKETLNILSNAYANALAESANIELGLSVPNMITSARLEEIVGAVISKGSDEGSLAFIFETDLKVAGYKIKANLYLIFNQSVYDSVIKKTV